MEEDIEEICVLCCNPHHSKSIAEGDELDQKVFKKFCRKILTTEDNDRGKDLLTGLTKAASDISICSICIFLLKNATECRELVLGVEGRVWELQRKILGELKELKRRMELFKGDIRRISDVVNKSEFITEVEVVGLLREEILNVAANLDKFNSNLSRRLLSSDNDASEVKVQNVKRTTGGDSRKRKIIKAEECHEAEDEDEVKEEIDVVERSMSPSLSEDYFTDTTSLTKNPLEEIEGVNEESILDEVSNYSGSGGAESVIDDDDEEWTEPVRRKSKRLKSKAIKRQRISKSNHPLDVHTAEMTNWRKTVVTRVLARCKRLLEENEECKKPILTGGHPDPRSDYLMEYDQETGYLTVGTIKDLVINDVDRSISCSKCNYKSSELLPYNHCGKGAEVQLYLHVLGHHLKAFTCPICSKNFKSWNYYAIHMRAHEEPEIFTCSTCGKSLCDKASLLQHIRIYHTEGSGKKVIPLLDTDSGLSLWRRTIVNRILTRAWKQKQIAESQDKISSEETDPFLTHPMEYDRETGHLTVGSIIDLNINDEEESVSCSKCDYKNSEPHGKGKGAERMLHWHVLGHHLKALNCHVCDKTFKSYSYYAIHIRTHKRPEEFSCSVCSKSFCDKNYLLKHESLHESTIRTKFPCPDCGGLFSKSGIGYHRRYSCLSIARNQNEMEPRSQCNLCSKTFKNEFQLKIHKRIAHTKNKKERQEMSTSRKRKRKTLPKSDVDHGVDMTGMKGMNAWRKHIVIRILTGVHMRLRWPHKTHPDPRSINPMGYDKETGHLTVGTINDLVMNDEEKSISCSRCDYTISGNRIADRCRWVEVKLFHHVLAEHLNAFRCPFCDKTPKSYFRFVNHIETHENPGGGICAFCGKVYSEKDALRKHISVHHKEGGDDSGGKSGQEKVQCSYCGKILKQVYLPKHEMIMHSSDLKVSVPTYSCPNCDKKFKFNSSLYLHLRSHCPIIKRDKPPQPPQPRLECNLCIKQGRCQPGTTSVRKTYRDAYWLKKHKLWYHCSESEKKYECKFCTTKFAVNWYLSRHLKERAAGTGLRKEVCKNNCGASYRNKCLLKEHEKTCSAGAGAGN